MFCPSHVMQKLHSVHSAVESPVSLSHTGTHITCIIIGSLSLISGISASFFPSVITSYVLHQAADWILVAEFKRVSRGKVERQAGEKDLTLLNSVCLSALLSLHHFVCVCVYVCMTEWGSSMTLWSKKHTHTLTHTLMYTDSVFDLSIVAFVFLSPLLKIRFWWFVLSSVNVSRLPVSCNCWTCLCS